MISMGFDIQCCAMHDQVSEEVGDTSNIKTCLPDRVRAGFFSAQIICHGFVRKAVFSFTSPSFAASWFLLQITNPQPKAH
jgi:hypothetical protein